MNRRDFLQTLPAAASLSAVAADPEPGTRITRIDLIHHTHTDVGYTDLPSVCRDMQRRFIDIALDTCIADSRFRWTIESTLGLDDWWQASTQARRDLLVARIEAGQMDAMAFAFNQAPFQDAAQWDQMLNWLAPPVWKAVNPRAAMQNDVNGLPRAGAIRLLDRGIQHLLMGINADSGGPPFRRPTAFWWKMPDNRRLFVWMGDHYGTAYSYFEPNRWIRQQPRWAQTEYRPPYPSELHKTDAASLRASHKHLLGRLAKLETEGYNYPSLILSCTNQWRYDNDPPLPQLAAFVESWNELRLQPALRFTTATDAVMRMEKEVGGRVPVMAGEWTDWWANGDASAPREVAASRAAKRFLAAAASPVWGPVQPADRREISVLRRDLCLFDEHTWGANFSVTQPYSFHSIGQFTEKSLLAWRPLAHAEVLLARRARGTLNKEGLHVANPTRDVWSGWAVFAASALRDGSGSAEDVATGKLIPLEKFGDSQVRLWIGSIAPGSVATFRLRAGNANGPSLEAPRIVTGVSGWPVSAVWPGMTEPLFEGECGDFLAAAFSGTSPRSAIARLHGTSDPSRRERIRRELLQFTPPVYSQAEVSDTNWTVEYRQVITHPRLERAERRIEFRKAEPRARITLRFDRVSSHAPEVFYAGFRCSASGADAGNVEWRGAF